MDDQTKQDLHREIDARKQLLIDQLTAGVENDSDEIGFAIVSSRVDAHHRALAHALLDQLVNFANLSITPFVEATGEIYPQPAYGHVKMFVDLLRLQADKWEEFGSDEAGTTDSAPQAPLVPLLNS